MAAALSKMDGARCRAGDRNFGPRAEWKVTGVRRNKKEHRKRKRQKKGNVIKKRKGRPHCEKRANSERVGGGGTVSGAQSADWRPACSFFMGQMSHCVAVCRVVCLQLGR